MCVRLTHHHQHLDIRKLLAFANTCEKNVFARFLIFVFFFFLHLSA